MKLRPITMALCAGVLGAALVACGGSSDSQPAGGGGATTSTNTGAGGAGTTSTTSTTSTTGAAGGAGGAGATGGGGQAAAGGQGGGGAGGAGGSEPVNGCERATATDRTTESTIALDWSNPHHECLRVAVGTEVSWTGNFTVHPLAGGVSPTKDPASPISTAVPVNGTESVTFASAGTFPYFCEVHTATMTGAIFVE